MLTEDTVQHVIKTYRAITSSSYMTNRHLEQIIIDTKKNMAHIKDEQLFFVTITYIERLLLIAYENKIPLTDRRLSYFIDAMMTELISMYNHAYENSENINNYLDQVISYVYTYAEDEQAPWPSLLYELAPHLHIEQLKYVYTHLKNKIEGTTYSYQLALTFSYIALLVTKEMTALSTLSAFKKEIHVYDVISHFTLLKERKRWQTMQQWVTVLFPKKTYCNFGSLQPYIDEMNSVLRQSEKVEADLWNRWLLSPNFEKFLLYTKYLSKKEEEQLITSLLPKLKERLHRDDAKKTYANLLLTYKKYDEGQQFLLSYEKDPFRMNAENAMLLAAIAKQKPALARPIYHQFIIRLVEKKTRENYKKAAAYIKSLQKIYASLHELDRFHEYIRILKNMYRTYRAFIEELKEIGY